MSQVGLAATGDLRHTPPALSPNAHLLPPPGSFPTLHRNTQSAPLLISCLRNSIDTTTSTCKGCFGGWKRRCLHRNGQRTSARQTKIQVNVD